MGRRAKVYLDKIILIHKYEEIGYMPIWENGRGAHVKLSPRMPMIRKKGQIITY